MWTHRRNVRNIRAHANGLKKEHDSSHAEEINRSHGQDHGKQAGKEARKRAAKAGLAAQKGDPLTAKQLSYQTDKYTSTTGGGDVAMWLGSKWIN
jgi:hypothetical protein